MTQLQLEIIAPLIIDGFTSGNYPTWSLKFSNIEIDNVSQQSLNHIVSQILKGFTCGEVIENDKNPDYNGWWDIS